MWLKLHSGRGASCKCILDHTLRGTCPKLLHYPGVGTYSMWQEQADVESINSTLN